MISYFGRVVLFATAASGSANISTTTFADADMSTKLVVSELLDGVMDQDDLMFKEDMFDS